MAFKVIHHIPGGFKACGIGGGGFLVEKLFGDKPN
jgi:hypothetical protein